MSDGDSGTSSDSYASPFDPNAFKHHSNSCTVRAKLFLFLRYNPAYRHPSPLIDKVDAEKVQQNTPNVTGVFLHDRAFWYERR
jgi:hypothetical protein